MSITDLEDFEGCGSLPNPTPPPTTNIQWYIKNGTWWIGDYDSGINAGGEEGLSAYEVAVRNGFVGTEQEWVSGILAGYNHSLVIGNPHDTSFNELEDTPTTVEGYGIIDALTDNDIARVPSEQTTINLLSGITPQNGYYNDIGNFIASANWRAYDNITDVSAGDVVVWKGRRSTSVTLSILFAVDSDGNNTYLIRNDINSPLLGEEIQVTVPAGTVKLKACFSSSVAHSLLKWSEVIPSQDGKVITVIEDIIEEKASSLNPVTINNQNLDFDFFNGHSIENQSVDISPAILEMVGKPLTKPTPFINIPFDVYKTRDNKYYSSLKESDYDFEDETSVTYYFSMDGDDYNDGLTADTPKKSLKNIILDLNENPPIGGATFYIISGSGKRFTTNEVVGVPVNFNVVIKGLGKPVITNEVVALPIKDGSTDAYYVAYAGVSAPIDMTFKNEMGDFKRLRAVSSRELCQSTPGSYFRTSTTVYYHLHDSREPDDNVIHLRYSPIFNIRSDRVYINNIELWGAYLDAGNTGLININRSSANQKTYFISDVKIVFGMESIAVNTNGDTLSVISRMYATGSAEDNIGYYGVPSPISNAMAVEIDCKSYYAGYNNDGSNNGTTLHHGWNAIRINSDYSYNENKNVADINAAKVWMLGCKASNATSPSVNINYSFSNSCEVWFDGCTAGGSTTDLELVGAGNIIHFSKEIPSDWIIVGSGTINTYPEEPWTSFVSSLQPDSFIDLLENSSPEQIDQIKTILGI